VDQRCEERDERAVPAGEIMGVETELGCGGRGLHVAIELLVRREAVLEPPVAAQMDAGSGLVQPGELEILLQQSCLGAITAKGQRRHRPARATGMMWA